MSLPQLSDEINQSIQKHLPMAVGEELRAVLNRAAETSKEAERQKVLADQRYVKIQELEAKLSESRDLDSRLAKLNELDKSLREREFKVLVAEKVHEERVERIRDLKEVTMSVFSNNRFKYTETGSVPIMRPGNAYPVYHSSTKTTEGEG